MNIKSLIKVGKSLLVATVVTLCWYLYVGDAVTYKDLNTVFFASYIGVLFEVILLQD